MATHKQAIKRHKQNLKRRERNKHGKSTLRSRVKNVLQAVEANNAEKAAAAMKEAQSILSDAGQKRIIHPRAASRKISRLARKVNALSQQSPQKPA